MKVKIFATLDPRLLSYPLVWKHIELQTVMAQSQYLTGSTAVGCVLSFCGSAVLVLVLVRLCHRHTKSRDRASNFVELCVLLIYLFR